MVHSTAKKAGPSCEESRPDLEPVGPNRLEVEAERKLKIPLVALRRRFAESGAGRIEIRPAPVRMIESIERLGAELEARRFRHSELLKQTDVPVLEPWVVD